MKKEQKMKKKVIGSFTKLDGEDFYKIQNYDCMEDFFMTITSSSDVWNFCWSQGGLSAGRIDANHAIFPYYTADKISDAKNVTGSYTVIAVKSQDKTGKIKTEFWEPFASLNTNSNFKNQANTFADSSAAAENQSADCANSATSSATSAATCADKTDSSCNQTAASKKSAETCTKSANESSSDEITRNIYKNLNGTKLCFEEINHKLKLSFRYTWTSSAKFGLIKMSKIENLGSQKKELVILDGCKNILPAEINSDLQNNSSVLLDAYKKTDLDPKSKIALFSLSSVLTDKAEPSECLKANTSFFTTESEVFLGENIVKEFFENNADLSKLTKVHVLKGERASFYLAKNLELKEKSYDSWEQVFDTFLSQTKIANLQSEVSNRQVAREKILKDIQETDNLMTTYLSEADGIQESAQKMTCVHHRANVMFNIMRGGFFADNGKINGSDFIKFIEERNKSKVQIAKNALGDLCFKNSILQEKLYEKISLANDAQLTRLYLEYLPIIFSRRHGDPSRPWNIFNIILNDKNGNPILNYEGNWRDIFQNWEALSYSYPSYIKNICAKFLNAMTIEGFNPYRINRKGLDWECPDPKNPWAQFGYWGDHQVIYLCKLLEFFEKTNKAELLNSLDEKIYSSSNIPYRLKSYQEICKNPRSSLIFDKELSDFLKSQSELYGSDKKLLQDSNGEVYLQTLTAKLLQIVIAKIANLVPGGGIWMNTQRPEWNDANNALAGWGLSVVSLCYLYRMICFLLKIYSQSTQKEFSVPKASLECFTSLINLYKNTDWEKTLTDDVERKNFTDKAGFIFETERNIFYSQKDFSDFADSDSQNSQTSKSSAISSQKISRAELCNSLEILENALKLNIKANKRSDGLFHSYNTMILSDKEIKISYLQEMLEGQVAVLSSGILNPQESLELFNSLKSSALFEKRQYSYLLYPNKELPDFLNKNNILQSDLENFNLEDFVNRSENLVLEKDLNGTYHFNDEFHNERIMKDFVNSLSENIKPSQSELENLSALYEKTFHHQNFTGRSGTFYAYEGLGSIYWHMVSKLLLAIQENCLAAFNLKSPYAKELENAYYDVRKGLSFNKTPELYGAFPFDPYSHTPFLKGAKQPGMTGQVKEEILTRWGELGLCLENSKVIFDPKILQDDEFFDDKTLSFTWCGTKIKYVKSGTKNLQVEFADGKKVLRNENSLSAEETQVLFKRNGAIKEIVINL